MVMDTSAYLFLQENEEISSMSVSSYGASQALDGLFTIRIQPFIDCLYMWLLL